jgi:hypothetical protein
MASRLGFEVSEEGVRISPQKFAAALDAIVTSGKLRAELERRPVETLQEFGIEIADRTRAELVGRRLSDAIPFERPGAARGLGQVAETYVHVGVDVAVSVVVSVVVGTVVDETLEEVAKVNIAKRTSIGR